MKRIILTAVIALLAMMASANNIQVSRITLTGNNSANQFVLIGFDLSWDNSWRISTGPANWDAAWVFAKFRLKGQTTWNHAILHYVNGSGGGDGHTVPSGAVIASSNDNGAGGA